MKYRIVKYEDEHSGEYYFSVEKKILWFWVNVFKKHYIYNKFHTFDNAYNALTHKVLNVEYKIIKNNNN